MSNLQIRKLIRAANFYHNAANMRGSYIDLTDAAKKILHGRPVALGFYTTDNSLNISWYYWCIILDCMREYGCKIVSERVYYYIKGYEDKNFITYKFTITNLNEL